MKSDRVLIVSHGHPQFSPGGGEIAAYQFYEEMNRQGVDTYFLAAHRFPNIYHSGTRFSKIAEKEILFFSHMTDYFLQHAYELHAVWSDFKDLLHHLKPTVVQFHHYLHLGIEMIREVKNYANDTGIDVKIVLTLHEYGLICANNGQMIKTGLRSIVLAVSPHRLLSLLSGENTG
jgi:hypothetical protein